MVCLGTRSLRLLTTFTTNWSQNFTAHKGQAASILRDIAQAFDLPRLEARRACDDHHLFGRGSFLLRCDQLLQGCGRASKLMDFHTPGLRGSVMRSIGGLAAMSPQSPPELSGNRKACLGALKLYQKRHLFFFSGQEAKCLPYYSLLWRDYDDFFKGTVSSIVCIVVVASVHQSFTGYPHYNKENSQSSDPAWKLKEGTCLTIKRCALDPQVLLLGLRRH